MQLKYQNDNDPWFLAEDIPNCDLFFAQFWLHCFVDDFYENTLKEYSKIMCKFEGYHLWFYFGEKNSYEVGKNIVNRIVNEDGYADRINKEILKQADKLRKYCETIPQEGIDKLSNKELWEIYNTQTKLHNDFYTWCWIPVAADMFHNNLTDRVRDYLRGIGIEEDKLNEYFITLTQPTKKSLIFIEQQELLEIGKVIEKDKDLVELFKSKDLTEIKNGLPDEIMSLLEKHCAKYYYTKTLFIPDVYVVEDYVKQLKDVFTIDKLPSELIDKQLKNLKYNKVKRDKLIKELKLNKKWKIVFDAFGDFMVTKIYRRYAQIFAIYQMNVVLKEITRRFHLTMKQVRFMLVPEVKELLLNGKCKSEELLERTKLCVYYAEKGADIIYVKDEAKEILKKVEKEIDKDVENLYGQIGCPGYAKGKVKIIIRAGDMDKMEEGDILVSIATDPDIVPAMKKAAAIVTEQGGVTSHAAIVSRELNIPCVIGTKIATRVFKDGDMVEVNANLGIVKKI